MDSKLQVAGVANPIGQRLKTEMKKRGMTSAELAKRADVKTSFLYDIISGKSANPSTVKLARVAESLDISLGYLVGNDEPTATSLPKVDNTYVTIARISPVEDGQPPSPECYYFRKSWIETHLKTAPEQLRMLTITGDSMEPTLCHNDMVLIDTGKQLPSPPGIFVLHDGLGFAAKRLEYSANRDSVRVTCDNAQYSSYERSIDTLTVAGRVVWFAREM